MRKHRNEIIKWANNPDSKVYYKDDLKWFGPLISPANWHEEFEYAVVLPDEDEKWQAFQDGRLELKTFEGWKTAQSFDSLKKSRTVHLWYLDNDIWREADNRQQGINYHVVPVEYEEVWQWYLEDVLQMKHGQSWITMDTPPSFDMELDCYRKKPIDLMEEIKKRGSGCVFDTVNQQFYYIQSVNSENVNLLVHGLMTMDRLRKIFTWPNGDKIEC